jgi:hypothetical protein
MGRELASACSFACRPVFGACLGNKNPAERGFWEADDGTRTHDLLHGHPWRQPEAPRRPPSCCDPVQPAGVEAAQVAATSEPPSCETRGPNRTNAGCDAIFPATRASPILKEVASWSSAGGANESVSAT